MLFNWLIPTVIVTLVVIMLVRRSSSRAEVAWFAGQYGVELTPANGGQIIDYLGRTTRWRGIGAFGALAAMIALRSLFGLFDDGGNLVAVLFGGWFAGGVLAELPIRRGPRVGVRAASLIPRSVADYVTPSARRILIASFIVLAAGIALRIAGSNESLLWSPTNAPSTDGWWWLAVAAGVGLVAVLGVHAIVQRSQPATTPDVEAAETAIRKAAVTRVIAGWTVVQAMLGGALGLGHQMDSPYDWAQTVLRFAILAVALTGWLWVPTRVVGRAERGSIRAAVLG